TVGAAAASDRPSTKLPSRATRNNAAASRQILSLPRHREKRPSSDRYQFFLDLLKDNRQPFFERRTHKRTALIIDSPVMRSHVLDERHRSRSRRRSRPTFFEAYNIAGRVPL